MVPPVSVHPVHLLRQDGEAYMGDLMLIRTYKGKQTRLATQAPTHHTGKDMERCYNNLVEIKNNWIHNGPPEYFESTYEILPNERQW